MYVHLRSVHCTFFLRGICISIVTDLESCGVLMQFEDELSDFKGNCFTRPVESGVTQLLMHCIDVCPTG